MYVSIHMQNSVNLEGYSRTFSPAAVHSISEPNPREKMVKNANLQAVCLHCEWSAEFWYAYIFHLTCEHKSSTLMR